MSRNFKWLQLRYIWDFILGVPPVVLSAPGAVITFSHICQLYRTDNFSFGPGHAYRSYCAVNELGVLNAARTKHILHPF